MLHSELNDAVLKKNTPIKLKTCDGHVEVTTNSELLQD